MSEVRKHARYSASSAHRWMRCPKSLQLADTLPPQIGSSAYAEDGTEAHELLEYALANKIRYAREAYRLGVFAHWVFRRDTPDDRIDAVQEALDFVYVILDAYIDAELFLEVGFAFPSNVVDPQDAYGFSDICIYVPSLFLLFVFDYKHGTKVVDIEDNYQITYYAVGAVHELRKQRRRVDDVCIALIQPRAFHLKGRIRSVYTTADKIMGFVPLVDEAILACQSIDAAYVPGEPQCDYCPARVACPAIEEKSLSALSSQFKNVKQVTAESFPDPKTLPLDRIAYILNLESLIDTWIKGVKQVAFEHASAGGYVPDHKIVFAQSRRKYDGDETSIAYDLLTYFDEDTSLDDIMPRKLIGITDMEARLKGEFRKSTRTRGEANKASAAASDVLAKHTLKQSSGKLTLVHTSDARQPVDRTALAFATVQIPSP